MTNQIEDSYIAFLIAKQIEGENDGFEHYLTVHVDDKSHALEIDYQWRSFHIGGRNGNLYIAERSSQVEGVSVHDMEVLEKQLTEISALAQNNGDNIEVESGAVLDTLEEEGLEIPSFLSASRTQD